MKRFGLGTTIAGLGAAGLLVAGVPAYAQSGSTTSGQATDPSQSGSTTSQGTGSTGSGSATMGTGSEQHAMGAESGKTELTGTVAKFDAETKELTLQNSDKKLKVTDTTRVMKDGQSASLSDIKEGDQVRASFSGTGDTLQVSRIDVMTAGSTGMGTGTTGSTGTSTGTTGTGSTGSGTTGSGTTESTPPSKGESPPPSKGESTPPSKGY
jgi:Cu/Ag efflux protein CusF